MRNAGLPDQREASARCQGRVPAMAALASDVEALRLRSYYRPKYAAFLAMSH